MKLFNDEKLKEIEDRCNAATAGPWYAKATDDDHSSNARYVSIDCGEFEHDNKQSLNVNNPTENYKSIIAITLLQNPLLTCTNKCDENTLFIAHAREDVELLIKEIKRLKSK